ncbi:MAG TPA: FAD-dependent monooxygenase [Vicinamibacterales bacterium]|nr:FAD-dependent monooxygenase [Vicinamibacterales bacterium]
MENATYRSGGSKPVDVDAPVLIVGAGPTGLIAAIELQRRGVSCRLIDRLPVPHTTSKAFTLHARTLEMMEHIGVAHRYVDNGTKSNGFVFNFMNTEEKPRLDFTTLPGQFPYILIYNQNETERVLRQHLDSAYGFHPEWGVQLMSLSQNGSDVSVKLRLANGETQEIRPRWVIGADGVRSRVRDSINIGYEGEDYQENILQMMDVGIQNFDQSDDWINYFVGQHHFHLITKLPGKNYRVLISDLGKANKEQLDETRAAFQEYVSAFSKCAKLDEPRWSTKWRVWRRLSARYRKDSVFLAGDSAHCNSPAGGSGMNVCMQDAFNLAWKIAMVEKGQLRPDFLETYESERKPVAQQLLEGTHALHEIIMGHGQGLEDRIAKTAEPGWHDAATRRISGMSYNYRDQLAASADSGLLGATAGDRAPDALLEPRLRLYDMTRHPALSLVVAPANAAEITAAQNLRDEVTRRWPQVRVLTVYPAGSESLDRDTAVDSNGELAAQWGGNTTGWAALVRPDNYIHQRTALSDVSRMTTTLAGMLIGS